MRDKGERNTAAYAQNRQSLQLTPSSTPVRPPRRKRPESASYDGYSVASSQVGKRQEKKEYHYGSQSLHRGEEKENVREKYFFGHPVTVQKSPSVRLSSSTSNYQNPSTNLIKESRSSTLGRQTNRSHQSTGNIYRATSREGRGGYSTHSAQARHLMKNEPHHLNLTLEKADRPARYQSSHELYTENRWRGGEGGGEERRRGGGELKQERHRSSDVYSSNREIHRREEERRGEVGRREDGGGGGRREGGRADAERKRKQSLWKEEIRGRPVDIYASSREIGIRPRGPGQDPGHRIIYSTESPVGSPSTKYRTKIIVGGPG